MSIDVTGAVSELLHKRNRGVELHPDLLLGNGGLELDSVALVEVLLECEETFGVVLAAELLASPALTVGALVERIQALQQ